jgi:hypothetical protein
MKTVRTLLLSIPLILASGFHGFCQDAKIPVVTIYASDPYASWSGKTGTFAVIREGSTNQTLNIYYLIGGTASNGVDYATIGNWVTIPAGVRSNNIVITPIEGGQSNVETVVLKLSPSPLAIPQNYVIGYPSEATVYITPEEVTNIPPMARIFVPTNGAVFDLPTDIQLAAFGSDPDGYVISVEFFAGDHSLGVVSNGVIVDPPFPDGTGPGSRAFFLTWTNPPVGDYILTAKATDNGGASSVSSPIKISVQETPPPTNKPPIVRITLPENGSSFFTPVDVSICAGASDPDGYVSTVEFFADDKSLGIKTNNPSSAGPANPFCLVWSNVPPGKYSLTAVATDNDGATTTSDPVKILVSKGPPTNTPPLVRISNPPNGAVFRAPVNVPIYAFANDRDGTVSAVEFFAGTNSLGQGRGFCLQPLPSGGPAFICPSNLFVLVWSNAAPGAYPLTAVATDNDGAAATSGVVKITILPSPPPPTNRPPIVNVIASDPIAIEGTNCWPWLGVASAAAPTWSDWTKPTAIWRFFTNCGPKNATFTMHRFGDTHDDLSVNYDVGGSATPGVDYVPLSGSVTIPAGQRHAEITVVPLDDGPPDISSTVAIKITRSTNYIIGYPREAAVLIIDSKWPRPFSGLLSDGTFHVEASGPDGAWFHLEYSTNLVDWTALCTNQVVNGSIDFIDPDAQGDYSRFYRTVPETYPPLY